MRINRVDWRNLFEEVKYWDALDLLRNFEEEMENARNGLIHWMLSPYMQFPQLIEDRNTMLLTPEISEKEGGIEIDFPHLENVEKDDIDIEIVNSDLLVIVKFKKSKDEKIIGWLRLKIPDDMNLETCEAELTRGKLKICLKKKEDLVTRKIILIQ